MRKRQYRRERAVIRFLFGGAAILVIVALAGFWGHRWYQHWQAQRFVRRAQTYLSWGDSQSAILSARYVLGIDPSNAEALRVLADVSERQGLSSAIGWRQQLVDNHPDALADVIALAKTAIQFGSVRTAEIALTRLAGKADANADYQEALGQLAVAKKNRNDAELHFQQAIKLRPDDAVLQLELAAVQLRSDDQATRAGGRAVLNELLKDPRLRVTAAKTLLQDAVERKDPELVQFAELLRSFPEAPFQDRLVCLQLFARLQLPQFASALTDAEEEAAASSDKLTALLAWLSMNERSLVALDWIKRLPRESLMKPPVFVAVADCYIAARDWAGLEQSCKSAKWEKLEFLRHAYLARFARAGDDTINGDLEWSKAIKEGTGPEDLQTLQRAAAKWGWKKESVDLLWALTNNGEKQKAALDTLYEYYGEEGDTGNLYRVAARLLRIAPDDLQAQNNFAQLSLLLNIETDRARSLARELYEGHKADANFASTYAFALYTQGHAQQAVGVMSALKEDDLTRPEIASYYGIILNAAGDRERARKFLEIGKAARLLPEEKKLFDDALARS